MTVTSMYFMIYCWYGLRRNDCFLRTSSVTLCLSCREVFFSGIHEGLIGFMIDETILEIISFTQFIGVTTVSLSDLEKILEFLECMLNPPDTVVSIYFLLIRVEIIALKDGFIASWLATSEQITCARDFIVHVLLGVAHCYMVKADMFLLRAC